MGLPRHIICVDAGAYARARRADTAGAHDLPDAVAFLLADFAEALNVYARLSAAGKGGADTPIPEMRQHVVTPAESHAGMAGFDTVVIGYAARTRRGSDARAAVAAADAEALPALLAQLGDVPAPGTRVYGLCAAFGATGSGTRDGTVDPPRAGDAPSSLSAACRARGLVWCGSLTVEHADLLPRLALSPRMGIFRRPVSEATDRLILAVRTGAAFDPETVRPGGRLLMRAGEFFRIPRAGSRRAYGA